MIVTIDFESAFGVHPITKENVTLSKLTTEEYIRHPLFKVHGVGLKVDNRPAFYVHGQDAIKKTFARIPWDKVAVLAHHAHFDMAILNWHYGIKPGFILDTLSMANALFPWESSSLASVCKRLGVPDKGTELATTKNKWSLTPEEMEVLGNYCIQDVEITRQCFDKMADGYPVSELKLIDQTVRMFTEPALVADLGVLLHEYKRERKHKRAFLQQADVNKETIMSNDKFALALENLGVVPPTKISEKTGKTAWAFAKSDEEFKQLLEHEDEQVRWLIEARLTNKTTIKETRTRRMFKTGKRGTIPVYLRYYGAHTSRWSGGDSANYQNLPRYNPSDPESGALRRALLAPEGSVCVVRDLGQIEARVLAHVAGQKDLLEVFRSGGDPYCHMATKLFGKPVTKADKLERQTGKSVVLGCGYGLGWLKFQDSLRVGFLGAPGVMYGEDTAGLLKIDVDKVLSDIVYYQLEKMTVEQAALNVRPGYVPVREHLVHCAVVKSIIDLYREANDKIVALWSECDRALTMMTRGNPVEIGTGVKLRCADDHIELPNGMRIQYHHLDSKKTYTSKTRGKSKVKNNIYGGRMVENCLTSDTDVLTPSGWKCIVQVQKSDLVWDGTAWCSHNGVVARGRSEVLSFGGVGITPDHRVLVNGAWVCAEEATYEEATSSFARHNRLPDGVLNGPELCRERQEEVPLAGGVRVWEEDRPPRDRAAEGEAEILRVYVGKDNVGTEHDTRDVRPPGVLGMAIHDFPLHTANPPSMEELRWEGDRGFRELAHVRGVLGRYGEHIFGGVAAGPERQFRELQQRELPLGDGEGEQQKQQKPGTCSDPVRSDACLGSIREIGYRENDAALQESGRVAPREDVRHARPYEQTYDILNAGPRRRFTVRGKDGRPFIVHNCVQALARIVIGEQWLAIAERYKVVLSTHDELVIVCPEAEAEEALAFMGEVMATPPSWAPDLPLTSDGGFNRSYGLCEK